MSIPIKNCEPIQITAGDTLSWQRSFSNYPASAGWQLTYELRGNGQAIEFSSTANGDTHVILVSAAITAPLRNAIIIIANIYFILSPLVFEDRTLLHHHRPVYMPALASS